MKVALIQQQWSALAAACLALLAMTQAGCITATYSAVPATRLPAIYQAETRCNKVPVNFTLLRQEPPKVYRLGGGDLLGVYVAGVLPAKIDEIPIVQQGTNQGFRDPYPVQGTLNSPNIGVPISMDNSGVLQLPLIDPINLTGKTLNEAADVIRGAYQEKGLLAAGKERVYVTLLRPRVHRVLVLRDDSRSDTPQLIQKTAQVLTKRGSGDTLDLPAYENDVLHVLAATGGLPGIETYNHVWVLKSQSVDRTPEEINARLEGGEDAEQVFRALDAKRTAIRIPLRVKPGEPLSFGPQDVILHDGDVVYLENRETEVFYTGGLLPGGEIPLPRDRDIDIMEAIAIANGSVGAPGGVTGAGVFRTGAGPGNIIPPTRGMVIRKLPNGQQLFIRVDLARAKRDPKERIIIQPGDFVMLHYKPGEIASNVALNFFNFNFTWISQ